MSPRFRFLTVLACVLFVTTAGHTETIRIRADSWMPYNGDPASETPGYAIEIARAIFEHQGITIEYQTMPWGDALKTAATGKIEAVVGANKEEGAGLVLPKEYIGLPRIGLFVLKQNSWHYDNVPSLHSVRLAVVQDYKYWPALDEYLEKHGEPGVKKFGGEHPLDDAMARLMAGEIDVLAETTSVFAWAAKTANRPMAEFRIAYLHEGDPVFMAFALGETSQRYAGLYDEGLCELRRSGDLAKILARHGQKDCQP